VGLLDSLSEGLGLELELDVSETELLLCADPVGDCPLVVCDEEFAALLILSEEPFPFVASTTTSTTAATAATTPTTIPTVLPVFLLGGGGGPGTG